MMKKVELVAEDISCNHCKMTIEKGISNVDGVSSVTVDIDAKSVSIDLDDDGTSVDALIAEMDELGYPAKLVQSS
ncbi:MAG: heavy-metal-associated domain-containing protein [Acidimicrobiaceae bacterium]|nr:heavy-metal-associated domain-containing protein [Acidimicrobiaceae bacterium]